MDSVFLSNLTSPPLLFFALGLLGAALRSDLEIPEQIAKFLSIYLLFSIGFKGGVALAENTLSLDIFAVLGTAMLISMLIPVGVFLWVRRFMTLADAAATAATYGSVSAVTFVTATSFLDAEGIAWSGYLVAAMALMESPAIIIGLLLFRLANKKYPKSSFYPQELVREAFLNGSVFLILGSLVIGFLSGNEGMRQLQPFVGDLFVGVLCLFLLDMGIIAMRRMQDITSQSNAKPLLLLVFGLTLPLLNGGLGLLASALLGLPEGDALLLIVLASSASYIAVPAAVRLALPEANVSIYLGMSLAITFPFNLLVGIPLYHAAAIWLLT